MAVEGGTCCAIAVVAHTWGIYAGATCAHGGRLTRENGGMRDLSELGQRDGWICWLCDTPVDPDASVNSDLGPSADSFFDAHAKKGVVTPGRLAHRSCNTMKGKKAPVVPWSKDLFVSDPAPIFESVQRLSKKAGREAVARCPTEQDANQASLWLRDRVSRLAPELVFSTQVTPGGGQYLLTLSRP
jgi:hypothetical protein